MTTTQPAQTGSIPERVLSVDEWNNASKIKFFKRYEGPYRIKKLKVVNQPIRKIIERHFEYMSRNLYFISAFGRFILGNEREDDVIKAEDIAGRTIAKATESMTRRVEQARTLIKHAGNDDEDTHFSKEQTMEVPITTPGASKYAELLRIADEFYTLNYTLWLDGEIDSKTKFHNESAARKEIQGVVKGIASQFMYILNQTRAKDANEAKKAGNHDEAGLEHDAVAVVDTAISADAMVGSVAASVEPGAATGTPASGTPASTDEVTPAGSSKRTTKKAAAASEQVAAAA